MIVFLLQIQNLLSLSFSVPQFQDIRDIFNISGHLRQCTTAHAQKFISENFDSIVNSVCQIFGEREIFRLFKGICSSLFVGPSASGLFICLMIDIPSNFGTVIFFLTPYFQLKCHVLCIKFERIY